MKEIFINLKSGLLFCLTYLGYFLGGFDTMLITLLLFMVIDYITGVLVAIKKKKLSSKVGFDGILKKAFIILLVGSVNLLGIALGINELRYLVISFYLANEGISIIENGAKLNVPIPQKILDVLHQLKDEEHE
jgi:toxin secretion/phage lysis holin